MVKERTQEEIKEGELATLFVQIWSVKVYVEINPCLEAFGVEGRCFGDSNPAFKDSVQGTGAETKIVWHQAKARKPPFRFFEQQLGSRF